MSVRSRYMERRFAVRNNTGQLDVEATVVNMTEHHGAAPRHGKQWIEHYEYVWVEGVGLVYKIVRRPRRLEYKSKPMKVEKARRIAEQLAKR